MSKETAKIIRKYRTMQNISLAKFAKQIASAFGNNWNISRQAVHGWENGSDLNYFAIAHLVQEEYGWISEMALEILQVMRPDLWK